MAPVLILCHGNKQILAQRHVVLCFNHTHAPKYSKWGWSAGSLHNTFTKDHLIGWQTIIIDIKTLSKDGLIIFQIYAESCKREFQQALKGLPVFPATETKFHKI